jgi:hypothetical protein
VSIRGKTEKVSVTLPRELAVEIRSIVPLGGISSFFTEALEHFIAYRRQKVALAKGFGAWKRDSHPDLVTAEDSTAYVRAIRAADNERLTRLTGADAK